MGNQPHFQPKPGLKFFSGEFLVIPYVSGKNASISPNGCLPRSKPHPLPLSGFAALLYSAAGKTVPGIPAAAFPNLYCSRLTNSIVWNGLLPL
jgi:hypothetical protein